MSREYQELIVTLRQVFRLYKSDIKPLLRGFILGLLLFVVVYGYQALSILLR
jgi:hypothetical protein